MKKLLLPLVALLFLSVGAKATLVTNNFQNVFFAQGIAIYTNNYYSFSIDVNTGLVNGDYLNQAIQPKGLVFYGLTSQFLLASYDVSSISNPTPNHLLSGLMIMNGGNHVLVDYMTDLIGLLPGSSFSFSAPNTASFGRFYWNLNNNDITLNQPNTIYYLGFIYSNDGSSHYAGYVKILTGPVVSANTIDYISIQEIVVNTDVNGSITIPGSPTGGGGSVPVHTPTDIALTASSINENVAVGSTVGTLSTTDVEVGDTFTYTLVSGAGSTDNATFNISGSNLRVTTSLNYEAKSSYSIRVRTTDQVGLWYEKQFTISVTDLEEQAYRILDLSGDIENVFTIAWTCEAGYSYQVQYSETLQTQDWHDLGTSRVWSGGDMTMSHTDTNAIGRDKRFYKVVRTLLP